MAAARKLLRCPDCGRHGVSLRLQADDVYVCRYEYLGCTFYAYDRGSAAADVDGRRRLAAANPDTTI